MTRPREGSRPLLWPPPLSLKGRPHQRPVKEHSILGLALSPCSGLPRNGWWGWHRGLDRSTCHYNRGTRVNDTARLPFHCSVTLSLATTALCPAAPQDQQGRRGLQDPGPRPLPGQRT